MARRAGIAAVTEGLDVSALALYEPPYFAGSNGTEHITTLELPACCSGRFVELAGAFITSTLLPAAPTAPQ